MLVARHRFREYVLQELLESCYQLLRGSYLATLSGAMASAATWQAYEGALFSLRTVNMAVKQKVLGRPRWVGAHTHTHSVSVVVSLLGVGVGCWGCLLCYGTIQLSGAYWYLLWCARHLEVWRACALAWWVSLIGDARQQTQCASRHNEIGH